jgi:hypothetical protein
MLFKSWRSPTLLVVFVLLGLVTWLYVDAELNRRRGEGEYADAVAATELTDPGWRWEALAKVRTVTPSASNSAELILRIKALIPPNWGDSEEDKEGDANLPPRNRAWSDETIGAARKGLRDLGRAVELARGLKDLPHGDRSPGRLLSSSDWMRSSLSPMGSGIGPATICLHSSTYLVRWATSRF